MSKVLTFGRKVRPKAIVVMLHGFNDTAEGNRREATAWAKGLEDMGVLVVVPQSPHESFFSEPGNLGYNWIQRGSDSEHRDWVAALRAAHKDTRASVRHLDQWLDSLLQKHGLSNDQLILSGFSQGSIPAAIGGARRRVRGVVVMGGVCVMPSWCNDGKRRPFLEWLNLEALIPKSASLGTQRTKFCIVNGTKDSYVKRRQNEAMFEPFDTFWYWDKGAGHDFSRKWYAVGLKWIRQLLKGA